MDLDEINEYLQRAHEIIGERTPGEVAYDDAVITQLSAGFSIKKAIASANKQFPEEALEPGAAYWSDLAARYEYIREHKIILRKLGRRD